MSLFPAYSTGRNIQESSSSDVEDLSKDNSNTWLTNSSFKSEIAFTRPVIYISSTSSEDESVQILSYPEEEKVPDKVIAVISDSSEDERQKSKKRHKKKKKKHKRKVKPEEKYERQVENVYTEDKIRDKRMCTVETLCSRVRPYYNSSQRNLGFISAKYSKKKVFPRYYLTNIDAQKAKKHDTVIKRTKSVEKPEEPLPEWCVNIDEERKSRTQEFNEKLEENPHDIELWLRYVDFQDVIVTYQPLSTNSRLACQKKLAIVEKALEKNSDSVELLKTKLSLMSELTPADQFSSDVDALLDKDSGNITLWQALIMANQSSVALCTIPSVLNLFTRCFFILRQRSRTNSSIYDTQILGTTYQCLTFLRHGGFWEQMWETIRMNLCLNLNLSKESLRFQSSIDEKNLIGLEEVILTSKLPLNQLWLRVESLRERCHWISVTSDQLELVGDSKRFVLSEDVADFIHPVVSNHSNFQLAVYALLSLKVPLLPTRDNTLKDLGLKELNWIFDSSEVLLPLAYPCVGEMAGHLKRKSLAENVIEGQLTSGPQFLRFHPAQEPYLDFVRSAFRVIADALPSSQRTSIYVWWLRFERLLVYFGKDDPLKSDNRGKKLKTILKEFLKKSENRSNLHFYREFALIEYEQGRCESSLSILETALQSENCCPATMSNTEEKAAVMSIFRSLFEILLNTKTYQETNKSHFIKIARLLVPQNAEDRLLAAENYLREFIEQFLLNEAPEESEDAFFMPSLICDSITCYAYLLLVEEHDVVEILHVFAKCLDHCKESPRLQERLYESELALLQLYVEKFPNSRSHLKNVLGNGMRSYPDNFYILSVFADVEYELPSWRQTSKSGKIRLWQAITMCLAENARIKHLKEAHLIDTAKSRLNKLLSFHRKLSRDPDMRHCPLLWRLYMLLLREENLCEKKGEEIYHESVSHCPWARSIYIDAAEIAPQQLTEIQDVIREKELRIHVTPEELDILRG